MNPSPHAVTFAAPAPGGWMRLADHFPGALTPEYQRIYAETAPPGMASYMARYGVLAATIDVAFVHGHLYIAPVPLTGPREMRRTPPSAAVWLLSRLHPAFRGRTRAAQRALTECPWRTAATHWFTVERAEWVQRNQQLEATDLANSSIEDLIAHLHTCRRLVVDGYRRHFELHGDDLPPIGLLLARCSEWVPITNHVTARYVEALSFARELHGAQVRTGTRITYLSHLLGVSSLVLEHHGDEDQAIAGLLHDSLEDRAPGAPDPEPTIRVWFGDRVADIVIACSDSRGHPKPPWADRKSAHVASLDDTRPDALLVALADKVHNARALAVDLETDGDDMWDRFDAPPDQILRYYRALLDVFTDRMGDHPLVLELDHALRRIWP